MPNELPLRKSVLIPVIPLALGSERYLLELIIEPAGFGAKSVSQFHQLKSHGLETAINVAQAALYAASLPPEPLLKGLKASLCNMRGPPTLFIANPLPGLSNASGAALGIAMGLLMYHGHCAWDRILVTGILSPNPSPSGLLPIEPTDRLADKLSAAMLLGYQQQLLPFIVPAQTTEDIATQVHCTEIIRALKSRNIAVMPVTSLQAALAAC